MNVAALYFQLEELLSGLLTGSTGLCEPSEAELSEHREEEQQVQSLLRTASTLKADISTAIIHCVRHAHTHTRPETPHVFSLLHASTFNHVTTPQIYVATL